MKLTLNPSGNMVFEGEGDVYKDFKFKTRNKKNIYFLLNGKSVDFKNDFNIKKGDDIKFKYIILNPFKSNRGFHSNSFLIRNMIGTSYYKLCNSFNVKNRHIKAYVNDYKVKFKNGCYNGSVVKNSSININYKINSSVVRNNIIHSSTRKEVYPEIYKNYAKEPGLPIVEYLRGEGNTYYESRYVSSRGEDKGIIRITVNRNLIGTESLNIKLKKGILIDKRANYKNFIFYKNSIREKFDIIGNDFEVLISDRNLASKSEGLDDYLIIFDIENGIIKKDKNGIIKNIISNKNDFLKQNFKKEFNLILDSIPLDNYIVSKLNNVGFDVNIKDNAYVLSSSEKINKIELPIENVKDVRLKNNIFYDRENFLVRYWIMNMALMYFVIFMLMFFVYFKNRSIKYKVKNNNILKTSFSVEEIRFFDKLKNFKPNVFNILYSLNLKGFVEITKNKSFFRFKRGEGNISLTKLESWALKKIFKDHSEFEINIKNSNIVRDKFGFYKRESKSFLMDNLDNHLVEFKNFKGINIYVTVFLVIANLIWSYLMFDNLSLNEQLIPYAVYFVMLFIFMYYNKIYIRDSEIVDEIETLKSIQINSNIYTTNNIESFKKLSIIKMINLVILNNEKMSSPIFRREFKNKIKKEDSLFDSIENRKFIKKYINDI